MRIPKSATFASAFENGGGDSLTFWQKRSRNPFLFSCYLVLFVSWIPPLKRKMKKNFRFIWSIWNKVLTFAPAFKMRAALFDNLFETRAVTTVLFLCFPLKNHVLQPVCQSVIYEKVLIFLIKKALYIWCVFPNPLLLHPLSRTGAAIVWHSDRNGVGTLSFFLVIWCCLFHEYRL